MNPLINVLKDEVTTTLLLTCLYKCVRQFKGWSNPSKWNEMDDVLDDVMKRIVFETDNRSAAILYLFVAKLTLLPMKIPQIVSNQMDIKHLDRTIGNVDKCSDSERSEQYDKLRDIFQMHHNLPIARWSKKLLEVFTQRAIVGHAEEIRFQIHVSTSINFKIKKTLFGNNCEIFIVRFCTSAICVASMEIHCLCE